MPSPHPPYEWKNSNSLFIDGYTITLDYEHGGSKKLSSERDFTIMKEKHFLDHYVSLIDKGYKNILELGVYQGGSFVFMDKLYKPSRISAIELSTTPIPSLDKYVEDNKERARLYYGVSQDDTRKLTEIIDCDFGGSLDLVVDDASHFYEPTKASFKAAFPKVRPGGTYIIEDWSWGFQDHFQKPTSPWFEQAAPANLAIDLMEDMILGPLIEDIRISRPMLVITRSGAKEGSVFSARARRGRETILL